MMVVAICPISMLASCGIRDRTNSHYQGKKEEKESEENRGNQAFRPIMERLLGKGLERSEGTSSIAQ